MAATPYTKIDIINLALDNLGQKGAPSINDIGNFGTAIDRQYRLVTTGILSCQDWRFATKVQQLSLNVDAPLAITGYKYQYTLPSDYLALRRLHPNIGDYQIYAHKKFYTNYTPLYIEYRFFPNEAEFPGYFVDYLSLAVAARLAKVVVRGQAMVQELMADAESAKQLAMFADAQSHPNLAIQDDPFMAARAGGGYAVPNIIVE